MKAKVLTEEETKILKKKALDILSVTRRNILSRYPFIGNIALRMEMVPVRDVRIRTACTDGNSVYFDIAFLSSLNQQEQMFVLSHEIWHAVMLHLVRRHNRDIDLFNIATDKEVNYMLMQDGFTAPPDLCFPTEKEKGKCAEEIYEMMLNDVKHNMKAKLSNIANDNGNGTSNSSDSQANGKNRKNKNNTSANKNIDHSKNGKDDGTLTGQFDKHIFDSDKNNVNGDPSNGNNNESNQPNDFKIVDKYGEVGYDSDFRPSISKDFADRMRETIISEAQRTEKMRGELPAHIKNLVKELTTPEIRWQEVLAQFVTRCYNSGIRSWIPPNRRHVYNDVYIQSRQSSKIKACIVIDTSGSTCGDRRVFLTELNGLVKSFGQYELTILCADAEVASCNTYTQDDYLNIEADGFEMAGGGGTSFCPAFDYVIDNQIDCDCLIYLTDGYGDAPKKNPIGIPVLWVITKDGTEDFCDWGQKIRFKHTDSNFE